jgi:thioredoxin-related protein
VGGDWCVWCLRLDKFFEDNPDLAGELQRQFVVVKINFSKENKNDKVLSAYPRIPGYPHIFVLDAGGRLLHSQDTGELEEGKGYSKEKVRDFLGKWGNTSED